MVGMNRRQALALLGISPAAIVQEPKPVVALEISQTIDVFTGRVLASTRWLSDGTLQEWNPLTWEYSTVGRYRPFPTPSLRQTPVSR